MLGDKVRPRIRWFAADPSQTFPQIRSTEAVYSAKYNGQTVLDLIAGEKSLRGNMEFALRGLVLGPLGWDVELIKRAVGISGATNDVGTSLHPGTTDGVQTLLIDLLIARPPSSIELLRFAYSHKCLSMSSSPVKHKSLDAAVLAAYATNSKLRKAWEVALSGKWEDMGAHGDEQCTLSERGRSDMLKEDVDQLVVSLRKGGNHDTVFVLRSSRFRTD